MTTQSEQAFYQNATSNPLLVKKPLIDKKHINSFRKIFIKNSIPDEVKEATLTGITISKSKKKYFLAINYKYENNLSTLDSNYLVDYVNNK